MWRGIYYPGRSGHLWSDTAVSKCDVKGFWLAVKPRVPQLAALAWLLLAVPSNSADVERSFSRLKNVLTPQRQGLSDDSIKQLTALYFNDMLWSVNNFMNHHYIMYFLLRTFCFSLSFIKTLFQCTVSFNPVLFFLAKHWLILHVSRN